MYTSIKHMTEQSWSTCEQFLREHNAHAVLTRLPLLWQLEPALHAACRAAKVPLCVTNPENMPVSAAAIQGIPLLDTVVTGASDLAAFVEYLQQEKIALPKNWLMVHAGAKVHDIPAVLQESGMSVLEEIKEEIQLYAKA